MPMPLAKCTEISCIFCLVPYFSYFICQYIQLVDIKAFGAKSVCCTVLRCSYSPSKGLIIVIMNLSNNILKLVVRVIYHDDTILAILFAAFFVDRCQPACFSVFWNKFFVCISVNKFCLYFCELSGPFFINSTGIVDGLQALLFLIDSIFVFASSTYLSSFLLTDMFIQICVLLVPLCSNFKCTFQFVYVDPFNIQYVYVTFLYICY